MFTDLIHRIRLEASSAYRMAEHAIAATERGQLVWSDGGEGSFMTEDDGITMSYTKVGEKGHFFLYGDDTIMLCKLSRLQCTRLDNAMSAQAA